MRISQTPASPPTSVRLEQGERPNLRRGAHAPGEAAQIRRFLDYYLPTTLKLLNAYDRMSGTGVSGENIDTTLAKVEG